MEDFTDTNTLPLSITQVHSTLYEDQLLASARAAGATADVSFPATSALDSWGTRHCCTRFDPEGFEIVYAAGVLIEVAETPTTDRHPFS